MSRHLKLIAAVAVVLVALSGFSPGRKGGGRSSSGGGCSSSSSSSQSSSSSDSGYDSDSRYDSDSGYAGGSSYDSDRDDDYGSTGGGSRRSGRHHSTTGTTGTRGSSSQRGTGSVEQCAARSGGKPKAVVEVDNPNRRGKTYRVTVEFVDASGSRIDRGSAEVTVGGRDEASVDVLMRNPDRLGDVADCLVESVEPAA